jgi:hypothetical protein
VDFPDFDITIDSINIQGDTPYVYEESTFIIIADDTSTYTTESISKHYFGMLISNDGLFISTLGNAMQLDDLIVGNYALSKSDFIDFYFEMKPIFLISFFLVGIFSSIINILLQSVVAYSLASIFKSAMGIALSFKQTYAIAIYSLVLPIIITKVLYLTNTSITMLSLLLVYTISTMFSVRALRSMKAKKSH